jgi:Kef-type K+ transport system membrane component KefB
VGLGRHEAAGIGAAMSARGAVEIVIADIALRAGLFRHPDPPPPIVEHLFSAVVIMAIVTSVLMPVGLRYFLAKPEPNRAS